MQTTLLGLAIAFILALIAALVGPHFVDWNQFRPQFEAEASRVIGAPVRVQGALDARLLPSPSLRLQSVVVGGANDAGKVRADKLDVEFSLGSLMRGEWRATELTINGVSLDVGLDSRGRIDWPMASGSFDLGSLSIDRLNMTGRVALHDAASRSTLELNDIAFSGDVRSLAGSVRGDGNFTVSDVRYPFRISTGQGPDGNGTRVHLTVDRGERPVTIDLDGLLSFDKRIPHFNGVATLAGPAPAHAASTGSRPWRVTAKLKADPVAARLEQIEASYGTEDAALKFTGLGDLRFGAAPALHVALSARQLDADKLLARDRSSAARIVPTLRTLLAAIPRMPLATQVELSMDQIIFGGRPVQTLTAKLSSRDASWTVDKIGFVAPGATSVALAGQIGQPGPEANFDGALTLDSSDPDTFAAWLQGRSDVPYRSQKPLHLRGRLALGPDRIAIDQLRAELDGGGRVEGRLAFEAAAKKVSRVEAVLNADRLDLDAAGPFLRAVAGPRSGWPDEGALALDVKSAVSSGQEYRPIAFRVAYGPKQITLSELKIGQQNDLTLDGGGTFDRTDSTGKLTLNATSPSFARIADLIAPVAPAVAARLSALPATPGSARLKLALAIGKNPSHPDRVDARANLGIEAPQLNGTVSVAGTPAVAALRGLDVQALGRTELTVDSKLSAGQGDALLALFGANRLVAAANGPAQFEGSVTGVWNGAIRLKAKLSGAGLDAGVQGTAEPWAAERKAALDVTVHGANFAPLFDLAPSDGRLRDVDLTSHLALAGDKLTLGNIDGALAGARMRGRVALDLANASIVDGEIGMASIDLAPVFAFAIGAAGKDATAPLGSGWLQSWRGRLTFQALRGVLPGGIELKPFSAIVKGDGASLTFDAIKGTIGGGDVSGRIDARPATDGIAVNARVELKGVDGAALHYGALAMPPGRVSAQMALGSQGRSPAALLGALSGNGVVTLNDARLAGLNPGAFDAALAASDSGKATNSDTLRQVVEPALLAAPLSVSSMQVSFNVRDGRLRVGTTALDGDGARALISGGYDIAADQADIRATLTSTSAGTATNRPELQIFAVGPSRTLHRTVDVSSLSSWLAVRAIDRETRRLDSIERGEAAPPATASVPPATASLPVQPAVAPPAAAPMDVPVPNRDPRRGASAKPHVAPSQPQAQNAPAATPHAAPPLPAPIEVKPAPGSARPPRSRAPLILTPPVPAAPRSAF